MNDQDRRRRAHAAAFSRRALLKRSAAALAVTALDRPASGAPSGGYVFVSSAYDTNLALNGISTYTQNPMTGALTFVTFTPNPNSPSFLALDPSRNFLYAGNEVFPTGGSVSAYKIGGDGSLSLLNTANSSNFPAAGPAYVSVHPAGKYLLTASWGGAYISAIQIMPDGSLGRLTDTVLHTGNLGPNQTQAHPHMIQADPSGKYIIVQDLGQDRTYIYTLNLTNGTFDTTPTIVASEPGSGPRHFAFHPDGTHMYSINEVGSLINVYQWSSAKGTLLLQNTFSTLPAGYVAAHGASTAAEVAVSLDGNFLYGSNRGFDSIFIASIKRYGRNLTGGELEYTWTRGETPRQFTFSPDGRFLYAGNQNTNTIAIFHVDTANGLLSATNQYVGVASPACILFR
jgi:6-phosphogluconolactonase (cycloisomerase 2 family)